LVKNTALYDKHVSLGAKIIPFAGFNMPVYYSGIIDEHLTVRNKVGVFDVSHMGEFIVRGKDSLEFLQYITSNDVSKLVPGKVQYSCFPNEKGGIVDDLLVYMLDEHEYMLVVNAANIEKDWNWIFGFSKKYEIALINASDQISQIAVQGPFATESMQSLTDINLSEIGYYTFLVGKFAGIEQVNISATGYTGAGGFEIYARNKDIAHIWDEVFKKGEKYGIKPIGLGARDTLRLEMGYCLYGNDITDVTSPLEAGLGWITKFTKNFISRELLEKQKTAGLTKKLVGMEILEKGIPRHDMEILNNNNQLIGRVTSGTMSPYLEKPIAMGYVFIEYSQTGTEVLISSRNKLLKAKVVPLPFINKISQ
jgi:aminomethyltransferase